jgi:hypothetical protein
MFEQIIMQHGHNKTTEWEVKKQPKEFKVWNSNGKFITGTYSAKKYCNKIKNK